MTVFMQKISSVLKSDSGAVAVEYGLLLSLIALACVAAMTTLGDKLEEILTAAAGKLVVATSAQ